MRNGAEAARAPCRRARPLAPRVPPPAPGLGIPGEAGSRLKGGKDGRMKCGKNLSFQSHFALPLLMVGRRRQGHTTRSLPFRPRSGKEPVKRRAKPSSGTAPCSALVRTDKAGAECSAVPSFRHREPGLCPSLVAICHGLTKANRQTTIYGSKLFALTAPICSVPRAGTWL